jgi:hypothetical protein
MTPDSCLQIVVIGRQMNAQLAAAWSRVTLMCGLRRQLNAMLRPR